MSMAKPAALHIAVTGLTCGFGESYTRPAVPAVMDWAGTSGAFADPDGNVWEIARNSG